MNAQGTGRAAARPPFAGRWWPSWRVTVVLAVLAAVVAAAAPPARAAGAYAPETDVGSLYNTTLMTGAQAYWEAGFTGKGVDVALIDSGVAPVPGLDGTDKLVHGPDVSFESQVPELAHLDTFGHGTHMAGIIAGRGAGAVDGSYAGDSDDFLGMAPDARLVSLKAADAAGATDVSQVIAAVDWVVEHKNDNGMNIRVLSLSFGTDSRQLPQVDPLAHAVERAWKQGIIVVVSAGNAGFNMANGGPGLTNPARDPYVVSVGASDPNGTTSTSDDALATFSSSGVPGALGSKNPDLLAPGRSVASLRVPGSTVDQAYGATAQVGEANFRGSGTSQATAVVAGAAALILQQRPNITPDQLKKLLTSTATALPAVKPEGQGKGVVNLAKALTTNTPSTKQSYTNSTGAGSLEAARGTPHLTDGVELRGEAVATGAPVDTADLASLRLSGRMWSGGGWTGRMWSGGEWAGRMWSGQLWSGRMWSSGEWAGRMWSGQAWTAGTWSGRMWSGVTWSGRMWSGDVWSSAGWN
jgi:serine protease AprX